MSKSLSAGPASIAAEKLAQQIRFGTPDGKAAAEQEILDRSRSDQQFKIAAVDSVSKLFTEPLHDSMELSLAAEILGRLGGDKALECLASNITRHTGVAGLSLAKYPAAAALQAVGHPATPFVLNALRSSDAEERYVAARILGELRDASVVPQLRAALSLEEDPQAKEAMQLALRNISAKQPHP